MSVIVIPEPAEDEVCPECETARLNPGVISGFWCPVCGWEENLR